MAQNANFNGYKIINVLNENNSAKLYKVIKNSDGLTYIINEIDFNLLNDLEKQNILKTIEVILSLKHPNIISYKDFFWKNNKTKICLIMENFGERNLSYFINNYRKLKLNINENVIWNFLNQILEGIKCIHDLNLIHKNINSENIFISEDLRTIKLGNFIETKLFDYNKIQNKFYYSPEVLLNNNYDNKCDIYSLGCVLFELTFKKLPFKAENLENLKEKIQNGIFNTNSNIYSEDLITIIKLLLMKDYNLRPNIYQLFNNSLIIKKKEKINYNLSKIKNDKFLEKNNMFNIKNMPSIKKYLSPINYLQKIKNNNNKINIYKINKKCPPKPPSKNFWPKVNNILPKLHDIIKKPILKKSNEIIKKNANLSINVDSIKYNYFKKIKKNQLKNNGIQKINNQLKDEIIIPKIKLKLNNLNKSFKVY